MAESVAGIIKKNNKFLLGKRKPGGAIGNLWEFPGGKVDENESHSEALKREFLEELEVNIEVKDFITKKDFISSDHSFTLFAYYIDLINNNYNLNEHVELKWLTIDEIIDLGDLLAPSDLLLLDSLKG